jgi:hypothetical protein
VNRPNTAIVVVTTSLLATVAPAHAADHLMKIGEVLLSQGGDGNVQFVELQDPGEPFPASNYEIEVYNTNGGSVGVVGLVVPAGTRRFLVATTAAATAFGVTADQNLTVALPNPGQVCFEKNGATRIHCLSWGTVNTPVMGTSGTASGAAPGDGQSLALSGASYVVGAPTPQNRAAGMPDAGPDVDSGAGVDAGGSPDGGGGPGADSDGGGGCGCRTTGSSLAWTTVLCVAVLVTTLRRRRR